MEVYTLYKLQTFIRRALALNLSEPVWISAELAECDHNRGHYYLQLVEQEEEIADVRAQARAIIWQATARKWERTHRISLSSLLHVGRKLQLLVAIEYHQRYGLSLHVEDLDSTYTLGQLAKDREATITQLKAEGIWDWNRMTVLPAVPQRLAIISSPQAAGLQDFLQQLTDTAHAYHFRTELFPAAMQGVQAGTEIQRQLRKLSRRQANYDAIVLLRGGGPRLDLTAFDELHLARAIARVPLPVISGIGHDQDQSVVDLLAHTSVKTPTAAAEFLIQRLFVFEQELHEKGLQIQHIIRLHIQKQSRALDQVAQNIQQLSRSKQQQTEWYLDVLAKSLPLAVKQQLKSAAQKLTHLTQIQQLLDIERTLDRGFALVSTKAGLLSGKNPLQSGEKLRIRYRDGEQEIEVK